VHDYYKFITLHGHAYEQFLRRSWHNNAFKYANLRITAKHDIDNEFLETLPETAHSLTYGQFLDAYGKLYYDYLLEGME
jgi:hypothetical protein